jgi:nucleoside-diphosphate-sugar epimerase
LSQCRPRQRFDINCAYGGVITIFLNRIAKSLPPIIFGDGEQTRDFISVYDIVEANMLALKSEEAVGKAVNIGSGNEITINQVAEILKKNMGQTQLPSTFNPAKTGDDRNVYANIDRAKKLLRFTPEYSFERGISTLIQWYTQNLGIP